MAVLTRIHLRHITTVLSTATPNQRIAFRSKKRWVSAKKALDHMRPCILYIVAIPDRGDTSGSTGLVEYQAELDEIVTNPRKGEEQTDHLLSWLLTGTELEEWTPPAQTLYALVNIRRLKKPFPITELVKLDGLTNISEGYKYSYSLVSPRPGTE
jgi:hypothetical protein